MAETHSQIRDRDVSLPYSRKSYIAASDSIKTEKEEQARCGYSENADEDEDGYGYGRDMSDEDEGSVTRWPCLVSRNIYLCIVAFPYSSKPTNHFTVVCGKAPVQSILRGKEN